MNQFIGRSFSRFGMVYTVIRNYESTGQANKYRCISNCDNVIDLSEIEVNNWLSVHEFAPKMRKTNVPA